MSMEFADITVSYDLHAGTFMDKIKGIRDSLVQNFPEDHRLKKTHTRHVLPKQDDAHPRLFDIILRAHHDGPHQAGGRFVRLRVRQDNIYLIGYRVNDAGNWFELGQEGHDPHHIPGSTFLGYGHNYNEIGDLGQVSLGRQALINAVDWITAATPVERQRRHALLVFAIMLCETTRLLPVQIYVRKIWQLQTEDAATRVPSWMQDMVRSWADLSLAVLRYDACLIRGNTQNAYVWKPVQLKIDLSVLQEIDRSAEIIDKKPHPTVVTVNIRTADELCKYISILLRGSKTIEQLANEPR